MNETLKSSYIHFRLCQVLEMKYFDLIFQWGLFDRCRNMFSFQNILVWICVYREKKDKARFDMLSAVTELRRRFITAIWFQTMYGNWRVSLFSITLVWIFGLNFTGQIQEKWSISIQQEEPWIHCAWQKWYIKPMLIKCTCILMHIVKPKYSPNLYITL